MCMLVIVFYANEQSATMFWKFSHVPNSNICIHDVFKTLDILMLQLSSCGLSTLQLFAFAIMII